MYAARVESRLAVPYIDPVDIGWLAGVIDGEGSIALSHGGTRSPHLRVQITNGSQSILDKTYRIYEAAGIAYSFKRERRGTTNVAVGTEGSLRLHELLRPHLVRQVEQFDVAVTFMLARYDGRQRVIWTTADREEWEALRRRFHKNGVFTH